MDKRKLNKSNFKDDPLHWCAANNWPKEVHKCLEKGDNPYRPNKDGLSPMHAAIAHNAYLAVNILLEQYTSHLAIVKEHMEKRFLWKKENCSWKKRPILIACTAEERGQVQLVASSCPSAIPFNVQVFVFFLTPHYGSQLVALDVCSAQKQSAVLQCINMLLPNGVLSVDRTDPRKDSMTYLQTACLYERVEKFRTLLEHGSQLSATGDGESIPLMTACRTMKLDIVKLLLTKYVNHYDPTVVDNQQKNAFHISLEKNNPKLTDYVLKALIKYRTARFGETESEAFNRIFPYKCEEYNYMTTWSLIRPNLKEMCGRYVLQYRLDLSHCNGERLNVVELLSRKIALDYCFEEIRRNPDILKLKEEDETTVLHHLFKHNHLDLIQELYDQHPTVRVFFETKAAFEVLRVTLTHRQVDRLILILEHHKEYLRSKPDELEEYAIGQTWFDRSVYREPFALLAAAFPEKEDVINDTIAQATKLQQKKSFTDRFNALNKLFEPEFASLKEEGVLLENLVDEHERNVLHQAVEWDELALIKNLLNCGIDLNRKDGEGNLPIFFVRSIAALDMLYDKTPVDATITNDTGYNLLHHSSRLGSHVGEAIQTKLLQLGFDVNQPTHDGNVPLSLAGCCSTVRFLLKHGANVELINGSALVNTLYRKQHCAGWALILKIAHLPWFEEIAHVFLPWLLGNQNRDFFTCSSGDYLEKYPEIRKQLFDSLYKHSRDEASTFFGTVCHRAINCCARWFLDYGYDIDIEVQDDYRYTPLVGLLSYMEEPNLDVVERLLKKGANVNTRNDWGRNALLAIVCNFRSAQWYGHTLTTIDMLLDYGADINIQDNDGNTALHYAFSDMHIELAELLIVRGADRKIKNNANKLPYQMVSKDLQPLYAFLGN
ncbi:putative ankyrin repeat protein RF_0381 [Anopheles funestus]|uniref:putative ankyrin repeat protein RF_0381 n=1 Tax=Anopheles funestus TaxID=62324 RepID=UPI0020C72066|nr:putative ankyrin repeat protein RF_0381 [Anopheles funestus]